MAISYLVSQEPLANLPLLRELGAQDDVLDLALLDLDVDELLDPLDGRRLDLLGRLLLLHQHGPEVHAAGHRDVDLELELLLAVVVGQHHPVVALIFLLAALEPDDHGVVLRPRPMIEPLLGDQVF